MPATALAQPEPSNVYGFTLWKHGNLPVYREQNKWVVHYPDGRAQEYSSGRALMRGLHNGRDPHIPVERYFKKKAERMQDNISAGVYQPTTLDIFGIKDFEINKPEKREELKTSALTPPPAKPANLGIDLAARGHEVRKLLFAGFGKRIIKMGYDPEDVLQDVYLGLLARNNGKCPWDANKSSFGHYVHMVCGCIVSNYHRKHNRVNMNERTGVRGIDDHEFVEVDVASSNLCRVRSDQSDSLEEGDMLNEILSMLKSQDQDVLFDKEHSRRELSLQVVPMLVSGWKRRDISKELGIREGVITRCINYIRLVCRELFAV